MKNFLMEVFSCVSRLINVLTGGTADMTFSARSHLDDLWTENVIDFVAYRVFGEKDHCRVWWLSEVKRSRQNITLHEAHQSTHEEMIYE
mgnify:CR=1 FL=1